MDDVVPCYICSRDLANGLQCDTCQQWQCQDCINADFSSSLPESLYQNLNELEFPWSCRECCNDSLPQQLLQNQVFTAEELQSYGVSSCTITSSAKPRRRHVSDPSVRRSTVTSSHGSMRTAPSLRRRPSHLHEERSEATVVSPNDSLCVVSHVPSQTQSTCVTHVPHKVRLAKNHTHHQTLSTVPPIDAHPFAVPVSVQAVPSPSVQCDPSVSMHANTMPLGPTHSNPTCSVSIASCQNTIAHDTTATTPMSATDPAHMFSLVNAMLKHMQASQEQDRQERVRQRQEDREDRRAEFKLLIDKLGTGTTMIADDVSEGFRYTGVQYTGAQCATPTQNMTATPLPRNTTQPTVKLPKTTLPKFGGDYLEWCNFWESFAVNVHNQAQLYPKQKLDFLHQCLWGPAKDKIKGLGYEGSSYEEAIQILKDHYGNPLHQLMAHWDAFTKLPPIKSDLSNLEVFTDNLRAVTMALRRQGTPAESLDSHVQHLMTKIPARLTDELTKIRLYQGQRQQPITMAELLSFLKDYNDLQKLTKPFSKPTSSFSPSHQSHAPVVSPSDFLTEQPTSVPTANFLHSSKQIGPQSPRNQPYPEQPRQSTFPVQSNLPRRCKFCSLLHKSVLCRKVPTAEARIAVVKKANLCFVCLGVDHRASSCPRVVPCTYCSKTDHHFSICYQRPLNSGPPLGRSTISTKPVRTNPQDSSSSTRTSEQSIFFACSDGGDGIIMPAFHCHVSNPETGEKERLFISKRVVLETCRFNATQTEKIDCGKVQLMLHGYNGFRFKMSCFSVKNMAPVLTTDPVVLPSQVRQKLLGFYPLNGLAKQVSHHKIDVLIGQDYINTFMGPRVSALHLYRDLFVHKTPLGNVVCGNASTSYSPAVQHLPHFFCQTRIENKVEEMWKLESIGIQPPDNEPAKAKGEEVLAAFNTSVKYTNGRYEVAFPWKEKYPRLATNFGIAKSRLQSTLRMLAPSGQVSENLITYDKIIKDQLEKKVIEVVNPSHMTENLVHYIAHFPVIRPERETTKVRIVYDASVKTNKEKRSLNDLIYAGPNLLTNLVGIMIRFRLYVIPVTADIEKAFLQVGLRPEDRDCTRFLWIKNLSSLRLEENLLFLRFARIPFGIIASPFLLIATVLLLLQCFGGALQKVIARNLYMDNVLLEANSTEEAISLYKESKSLFTKGSMNLREWISNDPAFNASLAPVDKAKGGSITKVLGLLWNTETDYLQIKYPNAKAEVRTKRQALQQLASVFDPLGLLNPINIRGKIFLQKLWKEDLTWDACLTPSLQEDWNAFESEFNQVKDYTFPRRLVYNKNEPVYLLCFCDASPDAYAANVYLHQNKVTNLLFSKARVAPLKPHLTIPQLELTAVLIGVRCMRFIESELDCIVTDRYPWSDSQIVLSWLHNTKTLNKFITKRKEEILKDPQIKFGYVKSDENPADLATRGISFTQFTESSLWKHGSEWLCLDINHWSLWSPALSTSMTLQHDSNAPSIATVQQPMASKSHGYTLLAHTTVKKSGIEWPFSLKPQEFSSLSKIYRVTAYCNRFISAIRNKLQPKSISIMPLEMKSSKIQWIQYAQRQLYPTEYRLLIAGKVNQTIKQLDLHLDSMCLIRCGSRIRAPHEPSLLLLPKNNEFTNLVIKDVHESVFHFRIKHTLAHLRREFWLPQGYSQVQKVLKSCFTCNRIMSSGFRPPKMGFLPKERVTPGIAFQHTGMDYAGPLIIKTTCSTDSGKRWVALFTCFQTRAIHLEVISNCTAEACLLGLTRFIGRRGTPTTIMSDNATQFVKCSSQLNLLWGEDQRESDVVEKFTSYFAKKGICWKFLPEHSPWFGGFYERMISLVKAALRKVLWRTALSEEELLTIIIQIEGVLNTRPLQVTGAKWGEHTTLTPSDFIAPSSRLNIPPGTDLDDPSYVPVPEYSSQSLARVWVQLQKRLSQFWNLWHVQYLRELKEAHRTYFRKHKCDVDRPPGIGEICLLKEPCPRASWKLGRVTELHPGPDGFTRFVSILLPSGTNTRRGVQDLVPLEMNAPESHHLAPGENVLNQNT